MDNQVGMHSGRVLPGFKRPGRVGAGYCSTTVPGTGTLADKKLDNGSVLTKIQHFLSYIAVPDVSRLKIQERPVL